MNQSKKYLIIAMIMILGSLTCGFAKTLVYNIAPGKTARSLNAVIPDGEKLNITGEQYTDTNCQMTSVTITGNITGVTDDGDGDDNITLELWDDGEVKDSKTIRIKVGTTQNIAVTLSFNSLYGTDASGVGIYIDEAQDSRNYMFSDDPFTPTDITGKCTDSTLLTVNKLGLGSGTVVSDIVGIDCGTDCSESYLSGTTITLSAIPDQGSVFLGWEGECIEQNQTSCIVDLNDSTVRITSRFEASQAYKDGYEDGKRWCKEHPKECGIAGTSSKVNIQKGWNLVGASCEVSISNLSNEQVLTVWSWDRDQNFWKFWSPIETYRTFMKNSGIKDIEYIPANHGFWISSNGEAIIDLCK